VDEARRTPPKDAGWLDSPPGRRGATLPRKRATEGDVIASIATRPDALWFFDSLAEVIRPSLAESKGVELTVPPGDMAPLHLHDEDERIYMLEGAATFYVGSDVLEKEAGQIVELPARSPHTHRASSEGARWLVLTESDRFARFVRAVSRPAELRAVPPKNGPLGYEEAERVTRIARGYGIEYFAPPGTLPTDL
jgi:quercetin dioxygenase-like cupin family protein